MSKVQGRGMREVLDDAEGLARVLRAMSGGKLDLQPVATGRRTPALPLSWGAARTEASAIASRE